MKTFLFLISLFMTLNIYSVTYSAHSIPLYSEMISRVIISKNADPVDAAKKQLRYLYGNLVFYNAGFDENAVVIQVRNIDVFSDRNEITYSAQFKTYWPKEVLVPESISVYLPMHLDEIFINETIKTFVNDCSYKQSASKLTWFVYLRPFNETCPLSKGKSDQFLKRDISFKLVPQVTGALSTEFVKTSWKGLIIYNKDSPNNPNDPSFKEFNTFNTHVENIFKSIPDRRYAPGIAETTHEINVEGKQITLKVLLLDSLQSIDPDELVMLQTFASRSNVFSYSGHAGIGSAIRFVDEMIVPYFKDHSIILINSCHTLGYTKRDLRHGYIYLVNAFLNYFGTFHQTNIPLITGLINEEPLEESLKFFPKVQRTIIINE